MLTEKDLKSLADLANCHLYVSSDYHVNNKDKPPVSYRIVPVQIDRDTFFQLLDLAGEALKAREWRRQAEARIAELEAMLPSEVGDHA